MKLTFHVDYHTNWGESIYITGNIPALGDNACNDAVLLDVTGDNRWSVAVDIPDSVKSFEYRYSVRNPEGTVRDEWGKPHTFHAPTKPVDVMIYDRWQDVPSDKPAYSSAFTECICRHSELDRSANPKAGHVYIEVDAPMVKDGWRLAVCGSAPAFGQWNVDKALKMNNARFPQWSVNVRASDVAPDTEYKFVIINDSDGSLIAWEGGGNRTFGVKADKTEATVISGMRFNNSLTPWRGAGTAIPVFSLRSENDFGVGDFYDLIPLIDWAVETGQTFIQILPINDTTMTHTWVDSYPYKANSIYALHPMYLRLTELGTIDDPERMDYYRKLAAELNDLCEIDYERVNQAKLAYAREIFKQNGKKITHSKDFREFMKNNGCWLRPYAAFCILRDRFNTPDFNEWGEFSTYSNTLVDRIAAENPEEMDFVCYIQYNLDKQIRHVSQYARAHKVAIKGDIPIGISRTSADAWMDPRLFNLDCQAGAPPDDFSVLGQNWGLPTYNWDKMSLDGFAWWKARFRKMSEYFDAYRIDHVLGFFRIWQIPMDALHGLLGIFNPALPYTPDELKYSYDFWINPGLQTKPYIMDWMLGDFFGEYTDEARERFLDPGHNGRYSLKSQFDTQHKVAGYFAGLEKSEKNDRLCNALLGLIDDVLFIEDPYEKGKYHPRIAAQFTYSYRALNDYERWCFDRLYNDFFYRRHNDFWYGKAMWKLPPLIDSTDMLVCAEDLGMIPACVPAVMQRLQILSLEIQRMPKDPNSPFGDTWSYPYYSVCTTSTHDMGGIRQWWEEDAAQTQRFYNDVLHQQGLAPHFAEPWICDRIVDLHLKSPSMLCILPLQDWLSVNGAIRRTDPRDEQINVPANPHHYWRYRMHLTIESLKANTGFSNYIRDKIVNSGR